jgi:hypothetical protein
MQSRAGRLHPAPQTPGGDKTLVGMGTVPGKTRYRTIGPIGRAGPPSGRLDRNGANPPGPRGHSLHRRETMRPFASGRSRRTFARARWSSGAEARERAARPRPSASSSGRRHDTSPTLGWPKLWNWRPISTIARASSAEQPLFNTHGRCSSAFCRNQARFAW